MKRVLQISDKMEKVLVNIKKEKRFCLFCEETVNVDDSACEYCPHCGHGFDFNYSYEICAGEDIANTSLELDIDNIYAL